MRVVLDTNVLISATFWTGSPKQLLNKVRRKEFIFLTSQVLLRGCLKSLQTGQAAGHNVNHSDVDHGFAGLG